MKFRMLKKKILLNKTSPKKSNWHHLFNLILVHLITVLDFKENNYSSKIKEEINISELEISKLRTNLVIQKLIIFPKII